MYNLILENQSGARLTFNELGGAFTITDIDGLYPPDATINTSEVALIDGQRFNSSKLEMRQLQIAFAIERDAAKNRIAVYDVIKSKKPIRVYYKSDTRDVYIDGYVQSLHITHFEAKQVATVSILCPETYWRSAQEVVNELSRIIDMFHFAFASTEEPEIVFGYIDEVASIEIENGGDAETGIVIELYARAAVSNPKVYDYLTREFIGLTIDMEAGDLITIDTRPGHKTAMLTRDAEVTNVFNSLMKGITWLTLATPGSVYTYEVGSGEATALVVTIRHENIFEGV